MLKTECLNLWNLLAVSVLIAASGLALPAQCYASASTAAPVSPVKGLEIERYLGRWYDVRSIPNWFQKGCTNTTADYSINSDQSIRVENRCIIPLSSVGSAGDGDGIDAPARQKEKVSFVVGKAWVKNDDNSVLKVSFACLFGLCTELFGGDYWVLALGPVENGLYTWAIVGEPKRKFGWVLSRTPFLSADTVSEIEHALIEQGYEPGSFNLTPQNTATQ